MAHPYHHARSSALFSEHDVAALYRGGMTSSNIARLGNISRRTVLRELKRLGVDRRIGGSPWRSGTSVVDHNFFHTIDTEGKAYWLGFVTADGCIHPGTITVALHPQDRNHLCKMREHLGIGNIVRDYGNGSYTRLSWSSPAMKQDLQALGVVARKSWCAYPAPISEELQRHYWRGLIDGDGSIGLQKNRGSIYPSVTMCGRKAIVEGFVLFCKNITPTNIHANTTQWEGHYQTILLGSHAKRVAEVLYSNSKVYLDRKYESWLAIKGEV